MYQKQYILFRPNYAFSGWKFGLKKGRGERTVVLELLIKHILHVLINNSRTAWPTEILMPLFSFSDNSLQDDYVI